MSGNYCRGCGVVIQSLHPGKPGYVPEERSAKNKSLVCQRCYRITHYGDIGTVNPEPAMINQSIRKAISFSDLLVVVVDFSDLTGTLPSWSGFLACKPYVLVINKSDLLPSRTKQSEVVEYLLQYIKSHGWERPCDIIMVSGLKGSGVKILAGRLGKETASGGKVSILGATNVGKSSLIKQLLIAEGSPNVPTVSKFPGTTMGLSNWSFLKGRITLIDTPGLVPGDRMGDLFCSECSSRLVPTAKIEQKLWNIKPEKGLIIGGLFGLEYLGTEETVIIAFASPELILHRTENAKVSGLLTEGPAWLNKLCQGCRRKLDWEEQIVHMDHNQDLSIAGLGWISLRGQAGDFKIRNPKGIRWEIRPALVGKRQ